MESLNTLLCVACAAIFLAGVSSQPNRLIQGRLIGGYYVADYQFTYQVSLRSVNDSQHFCSGAVLAERWIITSARCVHEFSNNDVQVFYGARSLSGYNKIMKVARIFIHPKFEKTFLNNDLAMLYTASKISFVLNVVNKIKLTTQESVENDVAIVAGWVSTSVRNWLIVNLIEVFSCPFKIK